MKSASLQGQVTDTAPEALVPHTEGLGPPGAVVGSPIHVPEDAEAVEHDKCGYLYIIIYTKNSYRVSI